MRLYICEKPDLARAIVAGLDGGVMDKGFYVCKEDTIVTWCYGHMLMLLEPEDYDPKYESWDLDLLPLPMSPYRKRPNPRTKDQYAIICNLIQKADEVINAGDPGAEGQLLIDEILTLVGYKGPTKRILINDNSIEAVQEALNNLQDNSLYHGLYVAAEARQVADQRYGYNMTRLYTGAARRAGHFGVFSVGRIQTPTLAMVLERERQYKEHKGTPFYQLSAVFSFGDITIKGSYQITEDDPQDSHQRITSEEFSVDLLKKIKGGQAIITAVNITRKDIPPSLPYDLVTLQADAAEMHKFKAKEVKGITQSLREKHNAITYNRTDSRYIPENHFAKAPEVLSVIQQTMPVLADEIAGANTTLKSPAFDSTKTPIHHAIIPTMTPADIKSMSAAEAKIYTMIARQYIAQFYPNHSQEEITVTIEIDGHSFMFTSKNTIQIGWKSLFGKKEKASPDVPHDKLKMLVEGMNGTCVRGESEAKVSQPLPLFTYRALLLEMDKKGFGTAATRDEILSSLFDHDLLAIQSIGSKDNVIGTTPGKELCAALPDFTKSAELIAHWQKQQEQIEDGKLSIDAFLDDLDKLIAEEIARVRREGIIVTVESRECPKCGNAMFKRKGPKGPFWGCNKYPECKGSLPIEEKKTGIPGKKWTRSKKAKP